MALGLGHLLARGVLGYSQGKRVGETEQRELEQTESAHAVRARRQMLEERLLNARIEGEQRRPTENIDPLSQEGIDARLKYDQRRRRVGRGASDPNVADQRAAVRMANDLYENSDEYDSWDDAFEEAQRRLRAAGRLGGGPAPTARPDPKRPIEVPQILRDYVAGQNRSPQAKTPAQWVSEVRSEHPDWSPEQIAAEARKRAGS